MVFSLWFGCVVADLETVAVEQQDRALLEVQSGVVLRWTRWTALIGQVVYTRVLWKVRRWYGSEEAWPNWLDESPRWGRRSAAVGRRADVVSSGQLVGVQL